MALLSGHGFLRRYCKTLQESSARIGAISAASVAMLLIINKPMVKSQFGFKNRRYKYFTVGKNPIDNSCDRRH